MKILIFFLSVLHHIYSEQDLREFETPKLVGEWVGKISRINDNSSEGQNFTIVFESINKNIVIGKVKYDDLVFLDGKNTFQGNYKNSNEIIFKISYEDEETNGIFYFGGLHELKIVNKTINGTVRNNKNELIAKFKLFKNEN